MNQDNNQEVQKAMAIDRPGILNKQQTIKLMRDSEISHCCEDEIDYSSFDLHISEDGWQIDAGFKGRKTRKIKSIIDSAINSKLGIKRIKIPQTGLPLYVNNTYLFKIDLITLL